MLQLTNYSKLPNVIFNSIELTPEEKIMLVYLTNRSNNFKREEDWFGVPLCDFGSDIGFTDAHKVSAVRDSLLSLDLIEYRRGGKGKASQYKIKWDSIYTNLTSRYNIPSNDYDKEELDIQIPEQPKTTINQPATSLTDFLKQHHDELYQYDKWESFAEENPVAENIRVSSNIGIISAKTLFQQMRNF